MSARAKKVLFPAFMVAVLAGFMATHTAAPVAAQEAKKEKKARAVDRTLRDSLNDEIDYAGIDERQTLAQALAYLAKKETVRIEINERAFKADGIDQVLSVSDGPEVATAEKPLSPGQYTLGKALQRLLDRVPVPCGARYVIRKDHIEVTTENAIRRELGLPVTKIDENNPAPPPIALVWEHFDDEPLDEAFKTLAEAMDVTILIDKGVATKVATKIDATLRNVPLDTAVELLAEMAGLAVVKRPGAYYVTSTEKAEKMGTKK